MNFHGINAIYRFEMARWGRTLWQSLITPVPARNSRNSTSAVFARSSRRKSKKS